MSVAGKARSKNAPGETGASGTNGHRPQASRVPSARPSIVSAGRWESPFHAFHASAAQVIAVFACLLRPVPEPLLQQLMQTTWSHGRHTIDLQAFVTQDWLTVEQDQGDRLYWRNDEVPWAAIRRAFRQFAYELPESGEAPYPRLHRGLLQLAMAEAAEAPSSKRWVHEAEAAIYLARLEHRAQALELARRILYPSGVRPRGADAQRERVKLIEMLISEMD